MAVAAGAAFSLVTNSSVSTEGIPIEAEVIKEVWYPTSASRSPVKVSPATVCMEVGAMQT